MRGFLKTLSVLFLLAAFVSVYTVRIYALCSALMLLAWICFLLCGAYYRSRRMVLVCAACWLLILIGFAATLAFPVANPALPLVLRYLRQFYYAVFLLPLSGLPALHAVCIPISLLMLGTSLVVYWFLYRSTTASKDRDD